MKKIFAIMLAVLMLGSMSVAMASACTTNFDWTTTSHDNCGQGKIEVIPYVKVNDGCGGYNWVVNECAAAVTSENVYYALRLTIEGYPDAEWWDAATVNVDYSGTATTDPGEIVAAGAIDVTSTGLDLEDEKNATVYYWNFEDAAWLKLVSKNADDTETVLLSTVEETNATAYTKTLTGSEYIQAVLINKASSAKVCATLASDAGDFTAGIVGKYYVTYTADTSLAVAEEEGGAAIVTFAITDGKVSGITVGTETCSPYTAAEVQAYYGLAIGTKVTQKLVNSNFGWDDEVEDCFQWGTAATAIVDVNCEISIPKTGDASVIAYAVMALVTAAGALKIKK